MTVYADVLVIVNLYIDFFLLWCVKKALGLSAKRRRLALGALLGGIVSLGALLPLPGWASLLLGVFTALGVTAAAFLPARPGLFALEALCFWAASLLLAGFFLFLLRFFAPGHIAVLGQVVYFDLSLPLLFFFTCGAYGVLSVLRRLLPHTLSAGRCGYLRIEEGGAAVEVYAKADTGSALREPFSGLPVIVCEAAAVEKLFPAGLPADLSQLVDAPAGKFRLVPYDSLGGKGLLPAFRPRRAALKGDDRPLDCYVALDPRPLSAGQFQALYNPDQFPEAAGWGNPKSKGRRSL